MTMDHDPRDTTTDPAAVLTEDSDDELADLQKEYELKKERLLQERARKRERSRTQVEVERSPSPPRKPAEKPVAAAKPKQSVFSRPVPVQRAAAPSLFASKLYDTKALSTQEIFSERVFEFENVPEKSNPAIGEEGCKDICSGEKLSCCYYDQHALLKVVLKFKVLRVEKLLAKVVAPNFEEPNYVNWCFAGIVVYKSEPKTSVKKQKYIALRIGNFVHTVDVMLFGHAFTKYWKVRPGDIVVILNPTVKKFGNNFTLSLLDDLENMLEVGKLKHFGRCSGNSKDGKRCKTVVDTLKYELCAYHEDSRYKQGSRMDLQGSVKPKAPQNRSGQSSAMYVDSNTHQPMFVQYNNVGFHEKDVVYQGGEQFDDSKYDRPIAESEARRLRKQRANQKLRQRLAETAAPSRLESLERLGLVHGGDQKSREASLEKVRLQAFKNTFLTGMGYDPTTDNRKVQKPSQLHSLQELRLLSKGKRVSLDPSHADVKKKRQKWKQNLSVAAQKSGGTEFSATPHTNSGGAATARGEDAPPPANNLRGNLKLEQPTTEKPTATIDYDDSFSDSDASDIEIDFPNEIDRSRYLMATLSSGTQSVTPQ